MNETLTAVLRQLRRSLLKACVKKDKDQAIRVLDAILDLEGCMLSRPNLLVYGILKAYIVNEDFERACALSLRFDRESR